MKIFTFIFSFAVALACQDKNLVQADAACDDFAKDEPTAYGLLQGRWKLTEIWAGRAGKQPLNKEVTLEFLKGGNVVVTENGKTITLPYQILPTFNDMLKVVPPMDYPADDPRHSYYLGYLFVCSNRLRVGNGVVDGTDYVYQKM